jgi:ribonucleoside-triphosphate reductase
MAELDVERYGLGEVQTAGGRDHPHYTSMMVVPPEAKLPLDECLRVESRFEALAPGSHFVKVPLGDAETDAEGLLSTTRRIVQDHKIGLYAFDRALTFCSSCQKTFRGEQSKCPNCGSVDGVTRFSRQPARYRII